MKAYLEVFFTFAKIGCMTFGGGYAMVPILERELIAKRGWTTMEELMDYYTIAQITPGIIAVNVSTFIGHKRRGALGGLIATLGFVLPGVCAVLLLALGLRTLAGSPLAGRAFAGIRIAVAALVVDTAVKLVGGKAYGRDAKALALLVLAFALSSVWNANPALIAAGAGLAGFALYRPRADKGRGGL